MKVFIILISVIVLAVIACVYSFNVGKHKYIHYQLDKVREQFDDVLKHLGPSSRFRQGLEMATKIVDRMNENYNGNYIENNEEL